MEYTYIFTEDIINYLYDKIIPIPKDLVYNDLNLIQLSSKVFTNLIFAYSMPG